MEIIKFLLSSLIILAIGLIITIRYYVIKTAQMKKEIKDLKNKMCPYTRFPASDHFETEVVTGPGRNGICSRGLRIVGADFDGDIVYKNIYR